MFFALKKAIPFYSLEPVIRYKMATFPPSYIFVPPRGVCFFALSLLGPSSPIFSLLCCDKAGKEVCQDSDLLRVPIYDFIILCRGFYYFLLTYLRFYNRAICLSAIGYSRQGALPSYGIVDSSCATIYDFLLTYLRFPSYLSTIELSTIDRVQSTLSPSTRRRSES